MAEDPRPPPGAHSLTRPYFTLNSHRCAPTAPRPQGQGRHATTRLLPACQDGGGARGHTSTLEQEATRPGDSERGDHRHCRAESLSLCLELPECRRQPPLPRRHLVADVARLRRLIVSVGVLSVPNQSPPGGVTGDAILENSCSWTVAEVPTNKLMVLHEAIASYPV